MTDIIVAVIAGGVAVVAAVIAVWGNIRTTNLIGEQNVKDAALKQEQDKQAREIERLDKLEQKRVKAERAVAKYREPLVRAAFDLQSRLYNILRRGFIDRFMVKGSDAESRYSIDNTAFVIGQYFAWTEITRKEILFIDLGSDDETRSLTKLQNTIFRSWGRDDWPLPMRIFAGEQRAIGEALFETNTLGTYCVGYGRFLRDFPRLASPPIDSIKDQVAALAQNVDQARVRLTAVQHGLIDMLALLDPNFIRFPREVRTKA